MRVFLYYQNEDGGVDGLAPYFASVAYLDSPGVPPVPVVHESGFGYYYFDHNDENSFFFTVNADDPRLNQYQKIISGIACGIPEYTFYNFNMTVVDQTGIPVSDMFVVAEHLNGTRFALPTNENGQIRTVVQPGYMKLTGRKRLFDFPEYVINITEDTDVAITVRDFKKDIVVGSGKTVIYDEIIYPSGKPAAGKEIKTILLSVSQGGGQKRKALTDRNGRFKISITAGKPHTIEIPQIGFARKITPDPGKFTLSELWDI